MNESNDRVFISSTIYDLVDLRAELASHIRDLGMEPLLAERPEFLSHENESAIALCLRRIEDSELVFVVIDHRYGDPLPSHGGISATQLEWSHAIKEGKKTHVFVRDRVMAAKSTWQASGRNDADHWPVKARDVRPLFEWIDQMEREEHWISQFQDSIDLKRRVDHILRRQASRAVIRRGIVDGSIPILIANCQCGSRTPGQHISYRVNITNTGDHPLLDLEVELAHVGRKQSPVLPATSDPLKLGLKVPWKGDQRTYSGLKTTLSVEFSTLKGQRIKQIFDTSIDTGDRKTTLREITLISHQSFEIS